MCTGLTLAGTPIHGGESAGGKPTGLRCCHPLGDDVPKPAGLWKYLVSPVTIPFQAQGASNLAKARTALGLKQARQEPNARSEDGPDGNS